MKIVGLTGGIGSGKSTVAQMFKNLGVPVYNSDSRAKDLMLSQDARKRITDLLGKEAYKKGGLNRSFIATKVFTNRELLTKLNQIVHPLVRKDFLSWCSEQDYPYVIQEAAIIFENGNEDFYDEIILVTAPKEERLNRIIRRDGSSRKNVLERMENQLPDANKIPFSDYVINNENLEKTLSEVRILHHRLLDNS